MLLIYPLLANYRPVYGLAYVVNSNDDVVDSNGCDANHCSLREAITAVNSNSGTGDISFHLLGSLTIKPTSPLPPILQPVTIDGTTQLGYSGTPIVELDGTSVTGFPGLQIIGGNSEVKGLVINRFGTGGIFLLSSHNIVDNNYIGTDVTGQIPLGNGGDGILVTQSFLLTPITNNIIGGTTPQERNIISGNGITGTAGISIQLADNNVVVGNYIGTDVSGNKPLGNFGQGIAIVEGANNIIGGVTPDTRNIVSANSEGILIIGSNSINNVIQGNYIGTDVTGTDNLGNKRAGVAIGFGTSNGSPVGEPSNNRVGGTTGITIGGPCTGACNLISGNDQGVVIYGTKTHGNKVLGNYIGTDLTGAKIFDAAGIKRLGNTQGIDVQAAHDNTIGGTTPQERNIISGNLKNGIRLKEVPGTPNLDTTPEFNEIKGNYIGTDVSGTADLGNTLNGIYIENGLDNTIGGNTPGARNLISGNDQSGVLVNGTESVGNIIKGNFIGTKVNGSTKLGNGLAGINIIDGSLNKIGDKAGITPGGSCNGGCNVISGNNIGVRISGDNAVFDSIRYNSIHHNNILAIDLAVDSTPKPTANDNNFDPTKTDIDNGPNDLMNFPTGVTAEFDGVNTKISGILNFNPSDMPIEIDLYSSDKVNPVGSFNFGDGQTYLMTVMSNEINPNGEFLKTFPGHIPHPFVSATATNRLDSTSEFGPSCGGGNGDPLNPDDDHDSLCDDWENNGIDTNGDGSADLDLAAPGLEAEPMHKDVFVEVDWFENHQPLDLQNVVDAFNNVPAGLLNNPDGQPGINLHIDLTSGDEITPEQPTTNDFAGLHAIKNTASNPEGTHGFFGTPEDRISPNGINIITAKKLVYHYSLWVHKRTGTTSPGVSECPADTGPREGCNDFIVATGALSETDANGHHIGSVAKQQALFMHELGHNLGLRHGGGDGINCKPNYLSIMNYALQFNIGVPERPLDFSRKALAPLLETNLDESKGVEVYINPATGLSARTLYGVGGHWFVRPTGSAINWDGDGIPTESGVAVNPNDINNLSVNGPKQCTGGGTNLVGFEDWSHLIYNFRDGKGFADSSLPDTTEIPEELTNENIELMEANPPADTVALPGISINDVSSTEGNSSTTNFDFTVTRAGNTTGTSSVQFATSAGTATAGTDYVSKSGTVNFAANQLTATVTVVVNGDTTVEPNETFFVNLSGCVNCTIADNLGQGTIQNDDAIPLPSVSINDVSQNEGNSSTTNFDFTVTRAGNTTGTSSVHFTTADGTASSLSDYSSNSGTLNFAAGETTKTINVDINGDTAVEPDETFNVNLSNCTLCNIADAKGVGTIENDDLVTVPSIFINDVAKTEGNVTTTDFNFTLTRSGTAAQLANPSSVTWATSDGTATAPSDYTAVPPTVISFAAGETSKTVTVLVNGDTTVEPNETFNVNLSVCVNCTITDNLGVGTIVNDDGVRDVDNDGVPDNIDQCLTVPGPASNNGCPEKQVVVGGEILGIDMSSLFVAGAFANAGWIIPITGVTAGIVGFFATRRIRR